VTTVRETIPTALQPEVDAALAWFNGREELPFEVTGIVDPETALEAPGARELRLVLCGGDRCEQRSFRVTQNEGGFDVALVDDASPQTQSGAPPAELDPPPGARRGWLEQVVGRHAFVVLLFYRGYW